ncbi:MAG: hypothetical protein JO044_14540 [Mycobacteriaceae bacterium]|nr:hypothetical protein [Mycobacteriaceae bacterium]
MATSDFGAQAFAQHVPDAEVHLPDGGHFLLESVLDKVTALMPGLSCEAFPRHLTTARRHLG